MSNANPLILISVIGESKASPENMEYATEVGALLAESGAVVVCGGMTNDFYNLFCNQLGPQLLH